MLLKWEVNERGDDERGKDTNGGEIKKKHKYIHIYTHIYAHVNTCAGTFRSTPFPRHAAWAHK